jgi:hypothetical protein
MTMYAITATSYRCIGSMDDIQLGETVVDAIPQSLLDTLAAMEMRRQRDALLVACDWTQGNDSPLSITTKTAWATYRQALRDVPAQSGFPDNITWPATP